MSNLRHLDLFSGIGGFSLAAQTVGGIETNQFVEIDPFCQKLLSKNFPGVPIHDNVKTFTAAPGQFDIITAGYPCQDISAANAKGKGLTGERSGLFFEVIRILCECRPRYLVLENSPALLNFRGGRDMGAILWSLSRCGYDADWSVVSACSVGAPHLRKRLFVVAYPNSIDGPIGMAVHGEDERPIQTIDHRQGDSPWPETPPRSSGMVNGLPTRVDRVRALGNAVVPQVAAIPLRAIVSKEKPTPVKTMNYIESLKSALTALREEEKLIRQTGVAAHGLSITQVSPNGRNKTYARLEASAGLCPNGKGTMSLGKVGSDEHRDWEQRIQNRCKLTAITRHAIALQTLIKDEDFAQIEGADSTFETVELLPNEPTETKPVHQADESWTEESWYQELEKAVAHLAGRSEPKVINLSLMPRRVYELFGSWSAHENRLRALYIDEYSADDEDINITIASIRTALRACSDAGLVTPVGKATNPREWKKANMDWPSYQVLTPTGEFTFLGSPQGFAALKKALGKERFEAALVPSIELKSA